MFLIFPPYSDAITVITFLKAKKNSSPKTDIRHWRSAKITTFTDVNRTVHKNSLKWIFENFDKKLCRFYDTSCWILHLNVRSIPKVFSPLKWGLKKKICNRIIQAEIYYKIKRI